MEKAPILVSKKLAEFIGATGDLRDFSTISYILFLKLLHGIPII